MAVIRNPILPGFNPDPSICRVGDDYYIATSTFEWFPGVQIHHSRDLINWRLVRRPLERASQLDLRGEPDSCGVWAPCLSYADGKFWLVFTDVKRFDGDFKDAHNYIVTAPAIEDGSRTAPVVACPIDPFASLTRSSPVPNARSTWLAGALTSITRPSATPVTCSPSA